MKKLLFAAVALAALSLPANANTIVNLGTNPVSGQGAFSNNDPGSVILPAISPQAGGSGLSSLGGAFVDTYNFLLTMPQTLTIAFATNTFAGGAPQFIAGFSGAILNASNQIVLGPQPSSSCAGVPDCQVFGGSAVLGPGAYHLNISGVAGVDAGYGGNLSTTALAVPGPIAGAGIPGLVAAFGVGMAWYRRRKVAQA